MGWKGTLRSISAAARAAERESQRRHKQALKEQIIEESSIAVEEWENYVGDLVSIHTSMNEIIDWHAIANSPCPEEPQFNNDHQNQAETAMGNFRPSFFHIFRGGSEKLRNQLEGNLAGAPERDRVDYEVRLEKHVSDVSEWESETNLARRLVKGEAEAIKEVIEELQSLADEGLIGSRIEFSISDGFVHAQPEVHSDEIVPNYRRKQLASGKLSETKMPVGQFNELYQDYVGSVALKVAGDLFHILPLNEMYVTCASRMLDPQTGHKKLMPILSVQFVRETFMQLNLDNLDPSDSMTNFNHTMDFKKTKGFAPVESLHPLVS